jgi:CDP-diacylglycerol---serine O-phosphatidyltransferase
MSEPNQLEAEALPKQNSPHQANAQRIEARREERRRGIYLLPNLLTTCAMFAGYYAIVASINSRWTDACVAVLIAAFFDGIDGRVARLTNTQSAFGVQYDSLSDLISFGLAPSLIMYNFSLVHLKEVSITLGKLGWLAAFLYAACAALRLARFNVQVGVQDKRYFQGLASPAAAGTMVSFVWAVQEYGGDGHGVAWITPFLTVLVALAMVSNLRYFSFKAWPEKVPFFWAIVMLVTIVAIAVEPPLALVSICFVYLLSGVVMSILGRRARRVALEGRAQNDAAPGEKAATSSEKELDDQTQLGDR